MSHSRAIAAANLNYLLTPFLKGRMSHDPLPHATVISHVAGCEAADRFLHHVVRHCPTGEELFCILANYRQCDPVCEREWLRGFTRRIQKALSDQR